MLGVRMRQLDVDVALHVPVQESALDVHDHGLVALVRHGVAQRHPHSPQRRRSGEELVEPVSGRPEAIVVVRSWRAMVDRRAADGQVVSPGEFQHPRPQRAGLDCRQIGLRSKILK